MTIGELKEALNRPEFKDDDDLYFPMGKGCFVIMASRNGEDVGVVIAED